MIGMLMTIVSSATRIMKMGSLGGGAREQVAVELLQSQREAFDWTLDCEEVQDV